MGCASRILVLFAAVYLGLHVAEASLEPSPAPSPTTTAVPSPTPKPTHREQPATPKPLPAQPTPRPVLPSAGRVTGVTATWYCKEGVSRCTVGYAGGYYAAISPDLAFLRGRTVTIRYGSSSVRVKIIDCNCAAHRAIDLYSDAFSRLASLSTGRLEDVVVEYRK